MPNDQRSRWSAKVKRSPGRHGLAAQSTIVDAAAVTSSWMKAAQKGYGSGSVGSGFRAVDYDGQGWGLQNRKIVKWIKG